MSTLTMLIMSVICSISYIMLCSSHPLLLRSFYAYCRFIYSRCLEPKCKTEISPSIIKEILDEDAFERWERLTFQVES
jgi:hypothetical protein